MAVVSTGVALETSVVEEGEPPNISGGHPGKQLKICVLLSSPLGTVFEGCDPDATPEIYLKEHDVKIVKLTKVRGSIPSALSGVLYPCCVFYPEIIPVPTSRLRPVSNVAFFTPGWSWYPHSGLRPVSNGACFTPG